MISPPWVTQCVYAELWSQPLDLSVLCDPGTTPGQQSVSSYHMCIPMASSCIKAKKSPEMKGNTTDWFIDLIQEDPIIQIKYVPKSQDGIS